MVAVLTFTIGEETLVEVRVGKHPLTIGRAVDNTLRSADRTMSRRHAAIRRQPDGSFEMEDVGSTYGTYVNGAKIGRKALATGDQLRIGELVVRVALVAATAVDEPEINPAIALELEAARDRIAGLVDQQADLRREVAHAQKEEELAVKERDEVERELKRLQGDHQVLRERHDEVDAKARKLDGELQSTKGTSASPAELDVVKKQLREAKNLVETLQGQLSAMEERDAAAIGQQKEIARLNEEIRRTRAQQLAAMDAVAPAMARIAALTAEINALRGK